MESSSSVLTRYNDFQKKRVRPEDYVKKYSQELGVDQIRSRVADARGAIQATDQAIRNTPGSVAGRTSGSLVSDAARNRIVANEMAPLQEAMSTQQAGFADAQADYRDTMGDVNNMSSLAYGADEDQATSLLGLFGAASEYEKQQEQIRQFNESLAEQKRQANMKGSGGFSPTLGGGGAPAASTNRFGDLEQFLKAKYQAQPNANRSTQDSWVRQWAAGNGINANASGDPSGIWSYYNSLFPWEQWNDARLLAESVNNQRRRELGL